MWKESHRLVYTTQQRPLPIYAQNSTALSSTKLKPLEIQGKRATDKLVFMDRLPGLATSILEDKWVRKN